MHLAQPDPTDKSVNAKVVFMPQKAARLSYECVEQLHAWIRANCPCALENEEFLPGIFMIVEMEVEAALKRQQASMFQKLCIQSAQ